MMRMANGRRPDRRRANGEQEAEILAALQQADVPMAVGETAERLVGDLAYSSVVTILGRLYEKGLLTRSPGPRPSPL